MYLVFHLSLTFFLCHIGYGKNRVTSVQITKFKWSSTTKISKENYNIIRFKNICQLLAIGLTQLTS